MDLTELYKTQISFSEWFEKIQYANKIEFRTEDNEKRERLAVLNRIIGLPFDKATKEDLRKVVADLNQTEYADETKKCFKIILRKLYRFIRGVEEKGVYPDEVKWISIAIPSNHKKLPEELLTEDEVKKIISRCDNLRDKTLIFPQEILGF